MKKTIFYLLAIFIIATACEKDEQAKKPDKTDKKSTEAVINTTKVNFDKTPVAENPKITLGMKDFSHSECKLFDFSKRKTREPKKVNIYGSSMVGCGYTETYSSEVEGCTGIGYLWILKDKKTGDYIYKEGSSSLVISSTCDNVNTRQPINATHKYFEVSLEVDFTDGSSKTSEPITVETFGVIELDSDLPPPPPTTPFLDISPNPATISIQIGLLVTANNDLSDYIPSEVKIFNQQGTIVKTATLQSTTLNISISNLQNGLYNVSLKARNGQIITERFIKQ